METTVTFDISEVSMESGRTYSGSFTVKTILTRRENFLVDRYKREIIGASPEGVPISPDIQMEAFMLAQLRVRIIKGPEWWARSEYGLNLEDSDIIVTLFAMCIQKETEVRQALKSEAEKALQNLKSTPIEP